MGAGRRDRGGRAGARRVRSGVLQRGSPPRPPPRPRACGPGSASARAGGRPGGVGGVHPGCRPASRDGDGWVRVDHPVVGRCDQRVRRGRRAHRRVRGRHSRSGLPGGRRAHRRFSCRSGRERIDLRVRRRPGRGGSTGAFAAATSARRLDRCVRRPRRAVFAELRRPGCGRRMWIRERSGGRVSNGPVDGCVRRRSPGVRRVPIGASTAVPPGRPPVSPVARSPLRRGRPTASRRWVRRRHPGGRGRRSRRAAVDTPTTDAFPAVPAAAPAEEVAPEAEDTPAPSKARRAGAFPAHGERGRAPDAVRARGAARRGGARALRRHRAVAARLHADDGDAGRAADVRRDRHDHRRDVGAGWAPAPRARRRPAARLGGAARTPEHHSAG